jgi:hypothetical protein
MKTNPDIINDVSYKHAKFLYKILWIVVDIKMINLIKCRFENIHTMMCRPEYKVFEHDFCTLWDK